MLPVVDPGALHSGGKGATGATAHIMCKAIVVFGAVGCGVLNCIVTLRCTGSGYTTSFRLEQCKVDPTML